MSSMVLFGLNLFHCVVIPGMIELKTFSPNEIILGLRHFKWQFHLIGRNFSKSRFQGKIGSPLSFLRFSQNKSWEGSRRARAIWVYSPVVVCLFVFVLVQP